MGIPLCSAIFRWYKEFTCPKPYEWWSKAFVFVSAVKISFYVGNGLEEGKNKLTVRSGRSRELKYRVRGALTLWCWRLLWQLHTTTVAVVLCAIWDMFSPLFCGSPQRRRKLKKVELIECLMLRIEYLCPLWIFRPVGFFCTNTSVCILQYIEEHSVFTWQFGHTS